MSKIVIEVYRGMISSVVTDIQYPDVTIIDEDILDDDPGQMYRLLPQYDPDIEKYIEDARKRIEKGEK